MQLILLVLLALAVLLGLGYSLALTDEESRQRVRGWRVRQIALHLWSYEEYRDDRWAPLHFSALGDERLLPRILDVRAPARWTDFPRWARDRRAEIIARLAAELRPRGYHLRAAADSDQPLPPRHQAPVL